MWLAFYNPAASGDVLMLTNDHQTKHPQVQRVDKVALVTDSQSKEVVAVNIFNLSDYFEMDQVGNVTLTDEQLSIINELIHASGFDTVIELDNSPKFVVGYVESCEPVEGSDHLSLTQTNIGTETLQIVCGASNIRQGLHVMVAKPGAVMPSGAIIWPGELRNVKSYGMICSARELGLTIEGTEVGIWELDETLEPGMALADVL